LKKVEVKVFATLRKHIQGEENQLEVKIEPGDTVADICARLGIPKDEVKMVFANNRKFSLDEQVIDGDSISLFPPVAGG